MMFATVGPIRNVPHPLFAGGDGDLMNALCHGTEDPYDQSALFNMDVSNIPYPSYDLIVYLGANSVHGGDRTGKIVLNGGAERDFTLPAGFFNGFAEITNATTPGNYIVFRGLTNPSLNLKVWGNGFNHLGPTGFQIVNYGAITGDTLPPVISTLNPADNATGVAVGANLVATFSETIAIGTGNITLKNLTDGTQTTIAGHRHHPGLDLRRRPDDQPDGEPRGRQELRHPDRRDRDQGPGQQHLRRDHQRHHLELRHRGRFRKLSTGALVWNGGGEHQHDRCESKNQCDGRSEPDRGLHR